MLDFRTEHILETTVVRVTGEVDLGNAKMLERELLQRATNNHLILDLSGLAYLDLSGVRALEAIQAFCQAHDRAIVLANPSLPLRRLFDLIELGQRMLIFDSRERALAHFQPNTGNPR